MVEYIRYEYNYVIYIALMMVGLYAVLARGNLVKKIIGLNILQTAVFLFYISIGKIHGATAPVMWPDKPPGMPYENPVPHVLMLTAIVVGVSTTAVALALILRIKGVYGTIEEDEILALSERENEPAPEPEVSAPEGAA